MHARDGYRSYLQSRVERRAVGVAALHVFNEGRVTAQEKENSS